jgi:predicted nucleic acid-binding protein
VKKIYLDTSAFFKIFVEEQASETVERLVGLARDKKISIVLSDWVINESLALVDENLRKNRISPIEAQSILSELIDMIQGRIQYENFIVYPITDKAIIGSRFVIQDYRIPASDALHVFIAGAAECDCLVSADGGLVTQLTTGPLKLIAFNIRVAKDVEKLFHFLSN